MKVIKHSAPFVGREEVRRIEKAVLSGILSSGDIVEKFEERIRKVVGTDFTVCVNSGSSAFFLILKFLPKVFSELRGKNEVIIPSFACSALTNAIFLAGLKPVFADIEPDTFSLSYGSVRKKMGRKTLCVVFVHSFGICSDLSDFISLGVPIVEGIAQSFGGAVKKNGKSKKAGAQGVASFTSFYATKVITTGEGGAVFTNSKELYLKIRDSVEYDKKDYTESDFRFNFKMSDISASVGLAQIGKLRRILSTRKKIADFYFKNLSEFEKEGIIKLPPRKNNIFFRFVVVLKRGDERTRNSIISYMRRRGVHADLPIWKPLHFFFGGVRKKEEMRNTELAYRLSISLPIHPAMNLKDAGYVSRIFSEALQKHVR